MTLLAWFSAALAADLDRYPLCAEVPDLPASGAARIRVPLELRSADDPPDGSDLILVDAEGRPVPFQRISAPDLPQTVQVAHVAPTEDPERFRVDAGAFALEGLRVRLPPGVPAARVTVTAGERVLARDVLVWQLGSSASADVPFDGVASGALAVTVAPTTAGALFGSGASGGPTFEGLRDSGPPIPDHRVPVEVDPPVIQENGWARIPLDLPLPLPVGGVELEVADPLFERDAGLAVLPVLDQLQGGVLTLGYEPEPRAPTTLTRAAIGDLRVERRTVVDRLPAGAAVQLVLLVDARGKVPLDVTGATVLVPGVDLVALDVGAGPHRLCGGAAPGTTAVSPLGSASAELARVAGEPVDPGEVAANPAFVPPEVRSNLASPSAFSGAARLRWGRPVSGAGLSRIPVPNEVSARARPDLGDLRLLVSGGQAQLPYLLEREPGDRPVDVTTSREERDGRSLIAVALPARGLLVSRIALHTDAALFDREVVVSVPEAGERLRPIRAVRWVGGDRPGVLMIEVGQVVDDELLIAVDNGDDPPLPVTDVEVAVAGHALIAVLPEDGGAELAYGDPALDPPQYDLGLLRDALHARVRDLPAAEVGAEAVRERPPLSALDRGLLGVGIGALALGLLVLAADLLRAVRRPDGPIARTPA